MSEKKENVSGDDEAKITDTVPQNTSEENPPTEITNAQNEEHQNGSLDGSEKTQDNRQQHSQCRAARTMIPGLPPIDLNQLTAILQDPSMPSHHIMKEVADKIMLKCKESESDGNSEGNTGNMVGMRGLIDTIFDVTIQRPDSDNSDDDETFQRIPREIPCSFCNKIFGSTMKWKTHVLVAHQDPSVLNLRRLSTSESDKKSNGSHRRLSRNTSKPDSVGTDMKTHHSSKTDSKQIIESFHKEENVPENQRQSSVVRPLQTAKSVSPSGKHIEIQEPQTGAEPSCKTLSSESEQKSKDSQIDPNKVTENINSTVNAEELQIQESTPRDIDSAEEKEISSPAEVHMEPQTFKQGPNMNPSSKKTLEGEQKEHSSMSDKTTTIDNTSGQDSVGGRKRKATSPIQEPSSPSPSSKVPSSHSKRSKKQTVEEPGYSSTHKLE